ncbi:MAG TPA: ceramidase domain-containing protein [Myxococcota bacterium]
MLSLLSSLAAARLDPSEINAHLADPSCPWAGFDAGTVSFCERRLCAWVAEPSNSWSCIAYIIVAIILVLWRVPTSRARIYALAAAQVLIGVGSFFFHASGTFVGEVVDQMGMFMLSSLILCFSAAQARGWSDNKTVVAYVSLVVASTLSMLVIRPIGIPLFATQMAIGVIWQLLQYKQSVGEAKASFRPFFQGLGIFAVSFAIWSTDISGLLCDPDNHFITGHAVWHTLDAICCLFLGRFYVRRFAAIEGPTTTTTTA